jgi:hypothetical protein
MPFPQSQHFDTWNSNVNMHVPGANFSADLDYVTGEYRADYGAVAAVNTAGILSGGSTVTPGSTSTFVADYKAKMGPFGRQISLVTAAGSTNPVTVYGRDYMGQPIRETFTLAGATPVLSAKMYKSIELVSWSGTGATGFNIGYTDVLGVPYRTIGAQTWLENNLAATAGTLVAGLPLASTPTSTSADPRGSVDFATASNGVINFSLIGLADLSSLYGNAHFS